MSLTHETDINGINLPGTLSQLPLELECAILEWLKDDRPTAASCSLVCRRWRPISQSLLFYAVSIDTFKYPSQGGEGKYRPDLIPNFLQFIRTNSNIAHHIRELELNGRHEATVTLELLHAVLEELAQLRVLGLYELRIDHAASPAEPTRPATPRTRRSLDGLSIVLCEFPSRQLADMFSIICLFSEIGHLAINGDGWATSSTSALEIYSTNYPLMVRSLSLYDLGETCTTAICRVVRASGALRGHLTSMTFRPWKKEAARAFASLVYDAGPYLTALTFHLEYAVDFVLPAEACKILTLSTCSALQTLKLHVTADDEQLAMEPDILDRWLPESFSACADLISSHQKALSVLHTVDIVTGSPSLWTGTGVIDAMEMSAQNAHAVWKPLDVALLTLRSLGRLEFTVLDRYDEMNEEQRTRLRSIVEAGLSGVLSMHKGAHDFFHFKCRSY